jgi:type IV pilus assembly protein PilV
MCKGSEWGFTLIEVLVAVFVLALGITGAAAMQLAALRTRHQSALLSNAVQLASAMADRMRANSAQMQLGDADNRYLNLAYDAGVASAPPPVSAASCFAARHCDSGQMADFDIDEFKRQVWSGLPAGRLVICRDNPAWDRGARALRWDCSATPGAPIVIKLGWRGKNPDGSPLQQDPRLDGPAVALALTGALQ